MNPLISQSASTPQSLYETTLVLSGMSAGSYTVAVGGSSGTPRSTNGTHAEILKAGDASGFSVTASLDIDGYIESASCRAVSVITDTGITAGQAKNEETVSKWVSRMLSRPFSFEQPTLGSQPRFLAAGIGVNEAIEFDQFDDWMSGETIPEMSISHACDLFVVFQTGIDVTTPQAILCDSQPGSRFRLGIDSGTLRYSHFDGVSHVDPRSIEVAADTTYVAELKWDTSVRGLSVNAVSDTGALAFEASGEDPASILGARTLSGADPFGGRIAQILLFSRVLSASERTLIYQLLQDKYLP